MPNADKAVPYIRWFFFTVLVALIPLIFNLLLEEMWGQDPTWTHLLEDGELYIISCALAGHALGQLLSQLRTAQADVGWRLIAAFGGFFVALLSGLGFSAVKSMHLLKGHLGTNTPVPLNQTWLLGSSLLVFAMALAVGLYAVMSESPEASEAGAQAKA